MTGKATHVFFFQNGNVAVTNEHGSQMPKVQGSLLDYTFIRRLARRIVEDHPELHGFDPTVAEYVAYYEAHPDAIAEHENDEELSAAASANALTWLEDRKKIIEAGDFAVMLLRQLFAPPPNHSVPTLGQLEQAIRLWDRATGNA